MVRSAAALAGTLEGEGMGGRVRVVVGKRAYTAASVIVAPRRHGNVAHARREGSMTRAYDSCWTWPQSNEDNKSSRICQTSRWAVFEVVKLEPMMCWMVWNDP